MKKEKKTTGQYDLFSLLDLPMPDIVQKAPVRCEVEDAAEVGEEKESYLVREERITNLAREHLKRQVDRFSLSSVEEVLYGAEIKMEEMGNRELFLKLRQIAAVFLKALQGQGAEETRLVEKQIEELTNGRLRVSLCNRPDVLRSFKAESGDDALRCEVKNGATSVVFYSVRDKSLPLERRLYIMKDAEQTLMMDIRTIMAACMLYAALENGLKDPDTEKIVLEQMEGELKPFEDLFIEEASFGKWRYKKIIFRQAWSVLYYHGNLFRAFRTIYKIKHSAMEQVKEYKDSVGNYAKSYMLKSNIPKKTVAAMERSLLNSAFGFVEYDEEVDLQKVGQIEKQFQAVRETYFPMIDCSGNAIRFRKLGNHKASGLYYPGMKCLCVDFRTTDSFIHEFGHLIDYEMGSLSLLPEFYEIRQKYESCLKRALGGTKGKLKGKYNMAYYLKPTEVFARSFERYCTDILGIKNDLLPVEYPETFYPSDEEYIKLVEEYFNNIIKRGGAVDETAGGTKKDVA